VNHHALVSHGSPSTHCGISLAQSPLLLCTAHLPLLHFLYLCHPWLHHLDFPSPSHLISCHPNHRQSPMVSRKVRRNCHEIWSIYKVSAFTFHLALGSSSASSSLLLSSPPSCACFSVLPAATDWDGEWTHSISDASFKVLSTLHASPKGFDRSLVGVASFCKANQANLAFVSSLCSSYHFRCSSLLFGVSAWLSWPSQPSSMFCISKTMFAPSGSWGWGWIWICEMSTNLLFLQVFLQVLWLSWGNLALAPTLKAEHVVLPQQ